MDAADAPYVPRVGVVLAEFLGVVPEWLTDDVAALWITQVDTAVLQQIEIASKHQVDPGVLAHLLEMSARYNQSVSAYVEQQLPQLDVTNAQGLAHSVVLVGRGDGAVSWDALRGMYHDAMITREEVAAAFPFIVEYSREVAAKIFLSALRESLELAVAVAASTDVVFLDYVHSAHPDQKLFPLLGTVEILTALPPEVAKKVLCADAVSWERKAELLVAMPKEHAIMILQTEDARTATDLLTHPNMPQAAALNLMMALSPERAGVALCRDPRSWDRTVELLAAMPSQRAATILETRDIPTVRYCLTHLRMPQAGMVGILTMFPPSDVVDIFWNMPRKRNAELLAAMSMQHAATILMEFPPEEAGNVLCDGPLLWDQAAGILAAMPRQYAVTILKSRHVSDVRNFLGTPSMPQAVALEILMTLPPEEAPKVFWDMPEEWQVGLLVTMPIQYFATVLYADSEDKVVYLLKQPNMPQALALDILMVLPPEDAGNVLCDEDMSRDQAAGLLAAIPRPYAATILETRKTGAVMELLTNPRMSQAAAAEILAALPPQEAQKFFGDLPEKRKVGILAAMPRQYAATILQTIDMATAILFLTHPKILPAAAEIMTHLPQALTVAIIGDSGMPWEISAHYLTTIDAYDAAAVISSDLVSWEITAAILSFMDYGDIASIIGSPNMRDDRAANIAEFLSKNEFGR